MLALLLSGCAIPKPGVDRWMNVEGRTNCQIFGDWNRYTWTGTCADGYATGNGELVGYGGSTKMWSYTGQLQRGLREGYGIMTYGPMTQTGSFRDGRLFSGTLTGNGQQYVYENGAEVRGGMAASSNDSSDSGLSTFAAVLGDVAQGVAASRGAAAPSTQPVPRTDTSTPTPVVAQSPYTTLTAAARSTPTPASTPSGTYPSANKKVARMAHECLKVDNLSNKGISTESAIMRNSCDEKVNYLYCVDSSNGGAIFPAESRSLGQEISGHMAATPFPSSVRTIRCAYIGLPAPKETACSFPAPCALKMAACEALAARHTLQHGKAI